MSHRINLSADAYESDNDKDQTGNSIVIGETRLHTSFAIPKNQVYGNYLDRDFIRLDFTGITPGATLKIETFPHTVQHVEHPNVSYEKYVSFGLSKYTTSWLEISNIKEDKHSVLIWTCDDPDVYFIDVCGWYIADYTISITEFTDLEADGYENDDTSHPANEILENNGFQTHSAHTKDDADWLYFDGMAGRYYCVAIDNNINFRIDVYAEDDLTNKITPVVSGYKFFGFNCRVTKRYYIKVTAFDVHETYNIKLEAVKGFMYGSAYNEYSNSTQGHIEPNGIYSVFNFHCIEDTEDFYALNLVDVEPGRYFVKLRSKEGDVIGNYSLGVSVVE